MRTIAAIFVACLPLALFNCSIAPIPDDVTRHSTYGIVQQIRCEARRAVLDHGQQFTNAAIAYDFDFHITEMNNANASFTGKLPFVGGGNFTLVGDSASNRFNRTRDADRNFKLVDTFDDLRRMNCAQEALEKNWIYPIDGDIGIYEVASTFMGLNKSADIPASGSPLFSFHDTLTFTTELSGGVNPSLTLLPVTGGFRITAADANLTASRHDFHKVTLGMCGGPQTSRAASKAGSRLAAAPLGISVISPAVGVQTNSALLSTTLIQTTANAKDCALVELDRQRIIALQDRSQNLLVGP